jgi:hypothetical protein
MYRVGCICLALLIGACSPCKRAQRVLARCPNAEADTHYVQRVDTHYVAYQRTDTLIHEHLLWDTVRIDSGRVRVRIVKRDSLLYVRAECLPDTVYIEGKDRVVTLTKQPPPFHVPVWVWIVAGLAGILLLLRLVR